MKSAAALFLVINCLSRCHGWTCDLGPQHSGATQIDAGQGQVVMRNDKSEAFVLSGSTWNRLSSVPIKHVSVGPAGIWGVDSSNKVYKYGGGDFLLFHGQGLQQVDAGGQDKIAGVTSSSTIHCLSSTVASAYKQGDSLSWSTFPGGLMYISCTSYGCWGVNSGQEIYFTLTDSCQIRGWVHVAGAAVMVEVGTDGTVFVVNAGGNLYQRTGISTDVPHGTDWLHISLPETIKHASYDLGSLWLVLTEGLIMKCTQRGWTCDLGPQYSGATQIDAGQGQVVMRNDKSEVFFLSGSTWNRLSSVPIKHVSVGPAGIWGVDSSNKVYKYGGGDFLLFHGQGLQQVDAGGQDKIAGVTSSSTIHCLSSTVASAYKQGDSLSWSTFPGGLMYISCTSYGCWGVNSAQGIYFTLTDSCQIRGWVHVAGAAVMVEVGTDGTVFVVNAGGNLYQRTGISADVPYGTDWLRIPLSKAIKHASYDLGSLWLVLTEGLIMKCTQHGWTCDLGPQHSGATQIDAGQGQVVMTNDKSEVFFLSGSTWNRLGSVRIKHVSVGPAGIWGVDSSEKVYKYVVDDFILLSDQNMIQLDAGGEGQVVGVTSSASTHCLKRGIASNFNQVGSLSWSTVNKTLLYISCSPHGCWTVMPSQYIFFTKITPDSCEAADWTLVNGDAVIVEAGTDGSVFMINGKGQLYERTGISSSYPMGTGWTLIPMTSNMRHVSYDQGVLWAINDIGSILKCKK